MESKNIFFALASFLVFIIILSMMGVLAPSTSKSVTVDRTNYLTPITYWRPPYRKNIVYAPDVYVAPGPYARRWPNRRYYY